MNYPSRTDPNDPKSILIRDRNRKKANRIMAINAGIYTKRRYYKPEIIHGLDSRDSVIPHIKKDMKNKFNVDKIQVTRINDSDLYEIYLIKDDEVIKTLKIPVEFLDVYSTAVNVIKRSGL